MRKKKWTTPLLTVLVRGKPGERVLSSCKMHGSTPGPEGVVAKCSYTQTESFCFGCLEPDPS